MVDVYPPRQSLVVCRKESVWDGNSSFLGRKEGTTQLGSGHGTLHLIEMQTLLFLNFSSLVGGVSTDYMDMCCVDDLVVTSTTIVTLAACPTATPAATAACACASVVAAALADVGPLVADAVASGVSSGMSSGLGPLTTAVKALATPSWVAWARALAPSGVNVVGAALFGLVGWFARILWERRQEGKEKAKKERAGEGRGEDGTRRVASAHSGLLPTFNVGTISRRSGRRTD
ncbi:hypothetical protein J7T55_015602 [Diaporthe amygdali]|uniref:uncharacterized protein n=1 Tax=Phomopsis amygdali TaxID=1214568 RepID=UPI0022FEC780|nr:uncharacterized protein J7T55_015602 [Diaporthe amygdali]KAJ0120867.1 hypothetical protein J7T55_015602 [Diaporthe amygdali]